jgi:hypothetical protein
VTTWNKEEQQEGRNNGRGTKQVEDVDRVDVQIFKVSNFNMHMNLCVVLI